MADDTTCKRCNGAGVLPADRWNAQAANRPGYTRQAVRCPECKGTGRG